MTDLNALKQLWQEPRDFPTTRPISKEELMALLEAKAADIRRRTLRRLRKEILTYFVMLVIPAAFLFLRHGVSPRAIWGTIGVSATLGLIIGALAYKEHQLRTLPLGASLRESLMELIATVDATMRLYMAAYMTCVLIGVALGEGFLLWRLGLSLVAILLLVPAVGFVFWCYRSGRHYLDRAFGRYRVELANCLTDLEGS